tara:strand:+ start:1641 stop:2363 length:723 start_codon:yes stop_codon:yes gene_type:complete
MTQEVVKYSGTNIRDIYNGINLFLKKEENETSKEQEDQIRKKKENETEKKRPFQCNECEIGVLLIDSKEGSMVCNNCGTVARQGINIVPEFIKEPEIDYRNKTKRINGVSQKVIDMVNRSSDDYMKKNSFKEDLEYFNSFTHLPLDELQYFETLLKNKSTVTSVSYIGKVVGVLLANILQKNLIPENEIKTSILTKRKVSEIPTSPLKKFKCNNCDVKCHTMKESRYHCTLLNKYNKKFI